MRAGDAGRYAASLNMEKPIYKCMAKGSDREAGPPRLSTNWVTSRRGLFRIYPDRVELGDWHIPFARVERAVAYRFPYLPFVKATVLELRADGRTYQFGFNPWARPLEHLPLPVEEREEGMKYSTPLIIMRVTLLICLISLLWLWLAQAA